MTTRKMLAVGLAALMLAGMALVAVHAAPPVSKGGMPQAGGSPGMLPPTPDQIVAGMAQTLGLSKAQQAKLKPIYAAQAKQMKALWNDGKLTMDQRAAKLVALQKSTDQQMRKVLTAAQIRKLDDLELDGLTKYLGLSEPQRTKIRPILASRKRQLEALAANTKLSGQQRFTKTGAIFKSTGEQIRAVLTPAQKKKFDQALKSMFGPVR